MPQENFTKASIAELLKKHSGKRVTIHDSKQPGLILDIRPTGAASFYLYKRVEGRPGKLRLGAADEMTVELMRDFYERLGKGESVTSAFAGAQGEALRVFRAENARGEAIALFGAFVINRAGN